MSREREVKGSRRVSRSDAIQKEQEFVIKQEDVNKVSLEGKRDEREIKKLDNKFVEPGQEIKAELDDLSVIENSRRAKHMYESSLSKMISLEKDEISLEKDEDQTESLPATENTREDFINKEEAEVKDDLTLKELNKSTKNNEEKESEKIEIAKDEIRELYWETLLQKLDQPLVICGLNFTDLVPEKESRNLKSRPSSLCGMTPPPPPPPPVKQSSKIADDGYTKTKKTIRLFYRDIWRDPKSSSLWDEMQFKTLQIDKEFLEVMFESRTKDSPRKKSTEISKKELCVLDHSRSNAINIGLKKFPPPKQIVNAILNMDSNIINREGIERLIRMMPTEEERFRIEQELSENPDIPLGSAEQFLHTMASITVLEARLKLWLFKSEFPSLEREVAEPLIDLKQGIAILEIHPTFKLILSYLLLIGNFLNDTEHTGFQIDYLSKLCEVKDTINKSPILYYICRMIVDKNPESTDFYSDIGAVTRASRVDYAELATTLKKMEEDCKDGRLHLQAIAEHDNHSKHNEIHKISEFLAEASQKIMMLTIARGLVERKFHNFLAWLGTPPTLIRETTPGEFCRMISEFALEYRGMKIRIVMEKEKMKSGNNNGVKKWSSMFAISPSERY